MVLIKRWSEAESFTIFENHVYTCKKIFAFAQIFAFFLAQFLGGCRSVYNQTARIWALGFLA